MAVFADILANDIIGSAYAGRNRSKRLTPGYGLFVDDSAVALAVRRTWSGNTKTGTGTGEMKPFGDHSNAGNISYRVTIDTAGDETTATFKWSNDGGATFHATLQPVSAMHRCFLEKGMYVLFAPGTYVLNDRWDWTALGTASQVTSLLVNSTTGAVTIPDLHAASVTVDTGTITTLNSTTATIATMSGNVVFPHQPVFNDSIWIATIRDTTGVIRIQQAATSPHILFTGDIQLVTNPTKILASDASTKITVATTGVTIPTLLGAVTASGAWTLSAAGTALTVTNNVSVGGSLTTTGNINTAGVWAPSFIITPTIYDALFGTIRVALATTSPHLKFTGDATLSGAMRVGSASNGANTTAGDFSALRAVLGTDAAMPASTSVYLNAAVRVNANIGFFNATPAAQQTSGANLTNNMTSGGTTDQVDTWTNLTTYSTDAAAIRNAVYQLARKLKQLNDGLRTLGLFT
jgi:hypothetical protein